MNVLTARLSGDALRAATPVIGVAVLAGAAAALAPSHPWHVLIAIAAIAFVCACVAQPEIGVLVLVAMGPLELALPANPESTLSLTKLAGLICFSSFLLNAIVVRRRLTFERVHTLVFLLLGISLLSTAAAADPEVAKSTTLRYASFVGLFFVLSQLGNSERLLVRIAWVLSLGSATTGALGLARFFSGQELQVRLPHGDPNDIGFMLATTLPLTLWLLGRTRGARRILVASLVGLISLSILLTLSRGALVGLGAAAVWMLLVDRRHVRALFATAAAVLIAVGLAVHFEGDQIARGLRAKETVATENVQSRLAAWHAAADFAARHPLLGIGPGNFAAQYQQEANVPAGQFVVKVVHNAYLDLAAELGVAAMVVFVAYVLLTLTRLFRLDREKRGPPGLASALTFSLIIAMCSAITLSEQYFAPFWLIGGLAAALWRERTPAAA